MPIASDDRGRKEAAEKGARVAAHWRGGIESLIELCVGVRDGLLAYGHDAALFNAFAAPLVERGVITADEALEGPSSSKLSMFKQIAEHEPLLRRREVAAKLATGYTIVYQAIVYFKNLEGSDGEQKIAQLVDMLADCPDDGAREYLIDQTRRLKQARKAAQTDQDNGETDGGAAGDTFRALRDAGEQFDFIAVTLGDELRPLTQPYADPTTLERCFPLHQLRKPRSALAIVGRNIDMIRLAERLIHVCGFDRPVAVLEPRRAACSNVTTGQVMVVARRGGMPLVLPDEPGTWLVEGDGAIDAPAVAGQICPEAKIRLDVFAAAPTEGWRSLIGENSWLEVP